MIDLSAAPKRIQELMDDGAAIDDAVGEAGLVGIEIKVWYEWEKTDDTLILEFHHKESKLRWLARFSGYDVEEVEVFGLVNSWEG